MDRLTITVAVGSGIAWGGKEAFDAWQNARSGRAPDERARAQQATLGRLARLFPGAVTVKRPD